MARITIVFENGLVINNTDICSGVDLSPAPSNLHALQWYDTKGELEFITDESGFKAPNEPITELPSWVDACIINMGIKQLADQKELEEKIKALAAANNP